MWKTLRGLLAMLAVFAMFAAACGDDSAEEPAAEAAGG